MTYICSRNHNTNAHCTVLWRWNLPIWLHKMHSIPTGHFASGPLHAADQTVCLLIPTSNPPPVTNYRETLNLTVSSL